MLIIFFSINKKKAELILKGERVTILENEKK